MGKIMMIYSIPKGDSSTRITFNRKLFEYNVQSHKGRYKRKSKGLLSDSDFEKPVRSCVIFDKKFLKKVKKISSELKIITKFYEVKEID